MPADDKVLSYFDVLLRQEDIDLLTGPFWLNDQCLAFYFEYLAREKFKDLSESVLLIPGAATYLLTSAGPDVAPIVLEPLDFSNKSLVLFAVNNNPDVSQAAGGSHWSLATYTRSDNTLRHCDSCTGMNRYVAQLLYTALAPLVSLNPSSPLKLMESGDGDGDGGCSCPQQENGYDCGMMVLAIAEILCERFKLCIDTTGVENIDFRIDPEEVGSVELNGKRREMHSLILKKCLESNK